MRRISANHLQILTANHQRDIDKYESTEAPESWSNHLLRGKISKKACFLRCLIEFQAIIGHIKYKTYHKSCKRLAGGTFLFSKGSVIKNGTEGRGRDFKICR